MLKSVFVTLIGLLLSVAIYRGLTIDKFETVDSLLLFAYSTLILIVSFMEKKHHTNNTKSS